MTDGYTISLVRKLGTATPLFGGKPWLRFYGWQPTRSYNGETKVIDIENDKTTNLCNVVRLALHTTDRIHYVSNDRSTITIELPMKLFNILYDAFVKMPMKLKRELFMQYKDDFSELVNTLENKHIQIRHKTK